MLSLAGVPVPPHMQGQPFLGQTPAAPREYVFGTHSRVDEAYDMSRCVRDKRYKYIRNFMPHLPYVQPSDYCDQAEIMQELRRVAKEGGLAGMEKLVLGADQAGRRVVRHADSIRTRSGTWPTRPNTRPILNRMRKRLWDWMVETKDTELLPEAEMHIRAAGSTPYDMARDPRKYPQARIFAAAELVGTGPRVLPALVDLLEDQDSAVRYWAAVGIGGPRPRGGSRRRTP